MQLSYMNIIFIIISVSVFCLHFGDNAYLCITLLFSDFAVTS